MSTPHIQEMVVVHRGFRRMLELAPGLVRALAPGDTVRIDIVTDHLRELLASLEIHHRGEDEYLWPLLRARVTPPAEVVVRMEDQHHRIEALSVAVESSIVELLADTGPVTRERLAAQLEALSSILNAHMDDEENSVLPLVAAHLTADEWDGLGRCGLAKVDKKKRLAALSALLDVATPAERQIFLAKVPGPVRLLWRYAGRRAYARAKDRLYAA
ncbi:hemerythrin domain-containing protein [Nocardia sp. NPDC052566]|uniref:hemerythrin domain-containing protein n=1 Tax=Nocardia sp. NPDC052566 TaxID=3364330 RepID=UPI0037C7D26B